MPIAKFIARRVLYGVATLLIISVLVFLLTQLLGDPAKAILGREARVAATLAGKREELGLNRPAINQYFGWLWDLLRGDPGTSYVNGVDIWSFMGERVVNSLFLVLLAAAVSIPLSLAVGAYSAIEARQAVRHGEQLHVVDPRVDARVRRRHVPGACCSR